MLDGQVVDPLGFAVCLLMAMGCSSITSANTSEVNWTLWLVLQISGVANNLQASWGASTTRSVSGVSEMRQESIRRECQSMMTTSIMNLLPIETE